jgi:hypothetical protein
MMSKIVREYKGLLLIYLKRNTASVASTDDSLLMNTFGMELNWRTTFLLKNDAVYIHIVVSTQLLVLR